MPWWWMRASWSQAARPRRLSAMLRRRAAWGGMAVVLSGLWPLRAAQVSADDPLARSAGQAIAGALNTALERARSNQPVPWGDPGADLTGSITVFAPAHQGGTWCRAFRYVVRSDREELTDSGLHCRDDVGLWRVGGVPDLLDKQTIVQAAEAARPAPSPPDSSLLRLQKNLVRLAYGGPADGSTDAAFATALARFEDDAGMRQGTDPNAIRRALALSAGMLARSSMGGVCRAPDGDDGTTLVCGRRR